METAEIDARGSLWTDPRIGRVLVWVVIALLLGDVLYPTFVLALVGDLVGVEPSLYFVQLLARVVVNGFLCMALFQGLAWARWVTVARLVLGLLVGAVELRGSGLASPATLLVLFLLVAPWLLALAILLAGPGVGAFFAQEPRRREEQRSFLDELEQADETARPASKSEAAGESAERPATDSPEQRFVRCVRDFDRVAGELGLEAYYRDPAAETAAALPAALEEIGAREAARIVRAAQALFPDGRPPEDLAERRSALEELPRADKRALRRLELELERHGEELIPLLHAHVTREDWLDEAGAP